MDKRETRGLSRKVLMPIWDESSRPWNIQRNVIGKSPSTIIHWTVIGWPEVSDPSPKLNGSNWGATTIPDQKMCMDIKLRNKKASAEWGENIFWGKLRTIFRLIGRMSNPGQGESRCDWYFRRNFEPCRYNFPRVRQRSNRWTRAKHGRLNE